MRLEGLAGRGKGAKAFPVDSLSGGKSFFDSSPSTGATQIWDVGSWGVFEDGSACAAFDKLEEPERFAVNADRDAATGV